MNKINRISKKLFMTTTFLLIVAGIMVAGILAYLAYMDRAGNRFVVGGVNTEIVEEFKPPKVIMPGTVIPKDVKVKSHGPSACYVRVLAVFADSDMGQYCAVDWNTKDWVKQADGYYYYVKPIAEGESTTSLFTQIKVKDDTPEAVIKDVDMIVYAESYQADGYSSWQEAWNDYQINRP